MSRNKQKLELTWIGKDKRPRLEPRILLEDPKKSYHAQERVSENDLFDNKLIFGDNLLALKALEAEYTGQVKCIYIDPPFRAYFARPTARQVIRAQARCSIARYVPASFSQRTRIRRNRFIQLWVRSTTHLRARNPASSRIARASSPLERMCAVKPNSCTTARTSW